MFHAAGIDAGGVGKDRGFIIGMVLVFLFHESFIQTGSGVKCGLIVNL